MKHFHLLSSALATLAKSQCSIRGKKKVQYNILIHKAKHCLHYVTLARQIF